MNIFNKIVSKFSFLAIALFASTFMLVGGTASARTQWIGPSTAAPSTPTFNEYYDVPNIGDEADFVRVKPKAAENSAYVDTLNDVCSTGSSFNVRTYIHNGANPDLNDNGNGSAVAKNVKVALQAELGAAKSKFKFTSSISASNAAGKTDSGYLNCNGKTVKLSLVQNSVQVYSKTYGFKGEPDSRVNGAPFAVGSQAQGTGIQWGCWEDRITVVYEVKVEEVPVVIPSDAICKIEGNKPVVVDSKKRTISIKIVPQLTNATVIGYRIDWGDGSADSTKQSDTHSYANDGKYTIQATLTVRLNDGRIKEVNEGCVTSVEFKEGKPPVVPPVTPPTTVTTLPNTGPANIFGIFAATSMVGAVLHRMYTARRAAARN